MLTLYDGEISGHSHRVRLFLALLAQPYQRVSVDLAGGENRLPGYLEKNPFGQIPVLDDDGTLVRDSNAILVYLARKFQADAWYPHEPLAMARVHEWLAVATLRIYNGPVKARAVKIFGRPWDHDAAVKESEDLLRIMDTHLSGREWLALDNATLADVSCYTYIAHAPEGDVSLAPYGAVRRWLERVEALPNFIPMKASPT
ncbi:MAG: glutathione S-transferase [Gammaproteobacteria bacterium]|nr:glutathione S-transferase [Gammaproteobacteria bacterium]